MQDEKQRFKIGDRVRLKSGGAEMMIVELELSGDRVTASDAIGVEVTLPAVCFVPSTESSS